MDKILFKFLLVILTFCVFLISCEDVIELDLNESSKRVVVNASIEIDRSQEYTNISIRFTETSNFNSDELLSPASVSNVTLEKLETGEQIQYSTLGTISERYIPSNSNSVFITDDNEIPTVFLTDLESTFILRFDYNNVTYEAQTKFIPSSPIMLTQTDVLSDTEIEITAHFTDIQDHENYYILEFNNNEFFPISDMFFENNVITLTYSQSILVDRDSTISIVKNIGADAQYHNYFNSILNQSEQEDPLFFFQIPRTTVRGNIIAIEPNSNINSENFALGYFSISEKYEDRIILF